MELGIAEGGRDFGGIRVFVDLTIYQDYLPLSWNSCSVFFCNQPTF